MGPSEQERATRIHFVTVNLEAPGATLEYVKSIRNLAPAGYAPQIVVVDNASGSGSFAELQSALAGITDLQLIRSPRNLGYFGGLNLGIRSLVRKEDEYVVVSNNDIVFESDFLVELSTCNCVEAYVLAPNIVTLDGFHQNPQLTRPHSFLKKLVLHIFHRHYYFAVGISIASQLMRWLRWPKEGGAWRERRYIHQGIGACYVLTPSFFGAHSLLDDRVFLWGEETLLSHQVRLAGGKILYEPKLVVQHQTKLRDTLFRSLGRRTDYELARRSFAVYSRYL